MWHRLLLGLLAAAAISCKVKAPAPAPIVAEERPRAKPLRVGPPSPHFRFSPDGAWVLYADNESGALAAVSIHGGRPRRLTAEGQRVTHLCAPIDDSPVKFGVEQGDENKILVVTTDGGASELYGAEGPYESGEAADVKLLARLGIVGAYPVRSGLSGALGAMKEKMLYAVDEDAKALVPVTDLRFRWRPEPVGDGRSLAFIAEDGQLYITDLKARRTHPVSGPVEGGGEIDPLYGAKADEGLFGFGVRRLDGGVELMTAQRGGAMKPSGRIGPGQRVAVRALPGQRRFVASLFTPRTETATVTTHFVFGAEPGSAVAFTCELGGYSSLQASPDGRRVAFVVNEEPSGDCVRGKGLYVMEVP